MGKDGAPELLGCASSYGIREGMVLFARGDEAGITGSASDQALVRAHASNICSDVAIRQLDPLEYTILVHEGAS